MWPAPILERLPYDADKAVEIEYVLANGEVRSLRRFENPEHTPEGKGYKKPNMIKTWGKGIWTTDKRVTFEGVTEEDITEYMEEVC